ncbi:MAG: hypothetical protein P4L62_01180 [Candidatus Pacebacteria bacterium]|nr:hypothetical protein [Candidatus Paceibacterota bacterium]MDR3582960.1 hypothetical protein [Candidatus Paceibacterota bacterium]
MTNGLSKKILATIIYYDILDYPLTSFEVWKYLLAVNGEQESVNNKKEKMSLAEVMKELESEDLQKHTEEYRGFYFLKGRRDLVAQRLERNKISERKLKKIQQTVFWLRMAPFVRMAAVTGRVAMKNATRKSDLDLLIALKNNRIFTGRLLVTLLVHALGRRRHGSKMTDRICLNYFITDGSLEIGSHDIFSAHEYSFTVPVFGGEVFQEFQKENSWIAEHKPAFAPDVVLGIKILEDTSWVRAVREFGEKIFNSDKLEARLKKWQMDRIVADPRTYQKGSGVTAGSDALVFLPDPQGPRVYEKYRERVDALAESATIYSG